ncbi:MAG: 3-methyl-2-oxobutanoate hydroxymethyltransferase [Firmicutes bacterium]|nr:3-methyl-2-oxobutanoate hydroxymethyltransferase [Bacillota bacterium]
MGKNTVTSIMKLKKENKKITMLTAYDYSTAKLLDNAGVNCLLVGDSLGMVMLGYENTLQVTLDDILHHTKAVSRGAKNALIIADMPFLTYHLDTYETIKNAGKLIQSGNAHAVKLEGGKEVADKIEALVKAQIPVCGHLGLTPQSVNVFGGFKVQGKDIKGAKKIIEDAKLLEQKGVFAIVLEAVPYKLAKLISKEVSIPTIGIGAGNGCDGQVLVTQDMLGMYSDFTPKFVKKYKNIAKDISDAVKTYIKEVGNGEFPRKEHTFSIKEEVINELKDKK